MKYQPDTHKDFEIVHQLYIMVNLFIRLTVQSVLYE
jgi:hypothetical protein